jgi:hypothetical protein
VSLQHDHATQRYLRRSRLTAAIATTPPATSESESGSGNGTAEANAGALTITVPNATAAIASKFFIRIPRRKPGQRQSNFDARIQNPL